jgi:murein DD-endopeptidase MepM/ murein hydrolase activator NlpD
VTFTSSAAELFQLPTANRSIFEPGGEAKYFVGTVGKSYTSGFFGCVRSEGSQMHEGIDIRALQRDKRGEATDPVLATADGEVAYANNRPGLSNYGKYVIVRHNLEGLELYSLYAHLAEIFPSTRAGKIVKAGEQIAIMGRTANTREGISKDRAHLHFEIDFLLSDRFPSWYKRRFPGQRNDHGMWNGQNLVGLDPRLLLLEQRRLGEHFSLRDFIQRQPELCRVVVRKTDFPWLRSARPLIASNSISQKEGIAGYELVLNYVGVLIQAIPRADSELRNTSKVRLLSVNEAEYRRNPCRKLVEKVSGRWQLTSRGQDLIGLIID